MPMSPVWYWTTSTLVNLLITAGGGGVLGGLTLFVIGEILFFVMHEFKVLFSVICDGSISRDA